MSPRTRRYRSPLREQQVVETRGRILQALADLITAGSIEDVSFRAVAEMAGVTEITVYRHFPDKQALLSAFWSWLDERLGQRGMPENEADLLEDTRVVLAGFDELAPIIRAALLTPQGREMRMAVQAERAAAFRAALAPATEGLSERERLRALAIVQLLYSGYAWLSMRDHWGLDGKEAGQASAWAIQVLLEHLHRERRRRARPTKASRTRKPGKEPS